jgi:hypothetical protein
MKEALKIKSKEQIGKFWIAKSNYCEGMNFSVHECEPDIFNIPSQHPRRFKTYKQALKYVQENQEK